MTNPLRALLLIVPCWIYLGGDEDAITCEEPADVVLQRVESAEPGSFIPFEVARLSRDDGVRTGYIRAGDIVAVMPMHPRQVEAELEDPPAAWLANRARNCSELASALRKKRKSYSCSVAYSGLLPGSLSAKP